MILNNKFYNLNIEIYYNNKNSKTKVYYQYTSYQIRQIQING